MWQGNGTGMLKACSNLSSSGTERCSIPGSEARGIAGRASLFREESGMADAGREWGGDILSMAFIYIIKRSIRKDVTNE